MELISNNDSILILLAINQLLIWSITAHLKIELQTTIAEVNTQFLTGYVVCLVCEPEPSEASFAYVTNQFFDDVSFTDTSSNTVIATVPVGSFPSGVAIQ